MSNFNNIIFYGAGYHAISSFEQWYKEGLEPVCFADRAIKKQHTMFQVGEKSYEILSLDEAISKYPDYSIFITTRNIAGVFDQLLELGIDEQRIINKPDYTAPEIPKWCPHIGTQFHIGGQGIGVCCEPHYSIRIPRTGDTKVDLNNYYQYCETLQHKLEQGIWNSCSNCPSLLSGKRNETAIIREITIATGIGGADICNFKCIYCFYRKNLSVYQQENEDNLLKIFKELSYNLPSNDILVTLGAGEFTLSPFCNEIVDILIEKNWRIRALFTNASIFNVKLANITNSINCSVDSGTRETFKIIKGVDCYDKVIANLRKYAFLGINITLKYILLKNINDNWDDISGFVDIAKELKSINPNINIQIARNLSDSHIAISDEQYELILQFVQMAKQHGLTCHFSTGQFEAEKGRMHRDGLL